MQAVKDLSHALERWGVAELKPRTDGRFSVAHDGDRRLDVHPLADGRLILEVHLISLPEPGAARLALLERALRFSTVRMPTRHDILCLSPDADGLLLQCEIPARAGPAAVEHALEQFLNAADAWWTALGLGVEVVTHRPAAPARLVTVLP
ncbi:MAG: CesT family type III secretion system chaperone [Hydrogenophaga sp.]|jgi:hypothetical protein|uniref:CesT family type III secretion system chaperone n=1 Tax=Hydrogenophaga sp. TaxID=1904254 RepID=UPI0040362C3B